MFKGSIWQCDVCNKKVTTRDGFPKEWFEVEIVTGEYTKRENLLLDACCCSELCLKELLKRFLETLDHYSTAHT